LKPRGGEVIGALQLINANDPTPENPQMVGVFTAEMEEYVSALTSIAATALYNRDLLEAQKALFEAVIQLIAGAIDTKSPYTGGHCLRVPELAMMLADAAAKTTEGPLVGFEFATEEHRREFRIAAWLHDAGKVTTPEYVVDKATKLETIYNRIHEIRTRFEVLLRDARIHRLEALLRGSDTEEQNRLLAEEEARLQEDFAFLAQANLGAEFLAPEKVARIQEIGKRTWWRHFDDRLGLSWEEQKRCAEDPVLPLPAKESLLADKALHIFRRGNDFHQLYDGYGFKIPIPEHLYNQGELYNLAIGRGTLTPEERFKINEHVMQTIVMLEKLPLPETLKRVPEIAGQHHETLIGTGYPRAVGADALSLESRILTIADIFEALSASDRPYKKPKALSECIKVLAMFKKDQHIDPNLFDLFLTSGVYKEYAKKYLKPEQLDEVDIHPFLG
jgi:HD-GYP domain-containing protein (c-di-GMP phosphodiesterase class II)